MVFETLYRAGKIELEIVPQGTLAERMRAAGAGVPAFFTATGVGTKMAVGKEHREIDGRTYILEQALKGDVGLVEAWEADRWGNLTYKQAGRNFNPICAMASELTLVQSQHIRELGEIDPDHVVTPGIFVDRVLHVPYGDPVRLLTVIAAQIVAMLPTNTETLTCPKPPPPPSSRSAARRWRSAPPPTSPRAGTSTWASASRP